MVVCVERIDESLEWSEIERKVRDAILKKDEIQIIPLAENKGLFLLNSWAEVCWPDSQGSKFIDQGRIGFHRWLSCHRTMSFAKRMTT